jgi:hypothetical protein
VRVVDLNLFRVFDAMMIHAKLRCGIVENYCGHRNFSRLIRYLDGPGEAIFYMKPESLSRGRLVRKGEMRMSKGAALT